MKNKNKYGFTLVELIVVITILAVLGTISFISLGGYSRDARDSKRIADLNSIRKVLEYKQLKDGYYILPENGVNVSYSTGGTTKAVWQQGIFGEESKKELGTNNGLSNVPRDPLTNTYYTYSVLNTKKEIQLGAVLEGGLSSNLQTTYAAGNNIGRSHIIGNYNGKIAKVSIGTNLYIFAVPSIISTDLTTPDILSLLSNNKLAFNNTTKLPSSYDRTDYNLDGDGNDLIVNNVTQPIISTNRGIDLNSEILISNLQDAYTGTTISYSQGIENILTLSNSTPEGTNTLSEYAETIIEDFVLISETTLPDTTGNTGTGNPEISSENLLCQDSHNQEYTDESYFTINDGTITGYDEILGGLDVVIPRVIGGEEVLKLSENGFADKGLTTIYIPCTVTHIEDYAFVENSSITEVYFGENIVYIGEGAFSENQLTQVTFPSSLDEIGAEAFTFNNNLTSIVINSDILIGLDAFKYLDGTGTGTLTAPQNVCDTYYNSNYFDLSTIVECN